MEDDDAEGVGAGGACAEGVGAEGVGAGAAWLGDSSGSGRALLMAHRPMQWGANSPNAAAGAHAGR